MKKLVFLTILFAVFISNPFYAQDANLEAGMKKGFDTFNDGETFETWIGGAKIMSELGEEYPEEWLPNYWASYFYTQLTFSIPKDHTDKQLTGQLMLEESQKNLDKALQRVKNKTPEIRSDFHILQTLIYDFRDWTSEDEAIKKEFQEKREMELKQAIRLNPNNPLLDVIIATDLIKKKDYTSVYAGRIILLHAKQKFDSRVVPRYMSVHWNEQWVAHWLSQSVKGLKALTAPE